MINQIEGLKKYTDCSMPSNEKQRIEKAECAAYNQAIDDVVKLFSIPDVVGQSEQLKCGECGSDQVTQCTISYASCRDCENYFKTL